MQARTFAKERIEAQLLRLRERLHPHRANLRRAALFIAFCGFTAALVWAAFSISDLWSRIALFPLVLLLVIGVPVAIVLNAAEFRAMLEAAGASAPWRMALEVTIYTSAANMLPIPGGVITRLGGMRARGVGMKQGSWMVLLFAGVWAGAAFLLSGFAILLRNALLGAPFLATGAVLLALSIVSLRRQNTHYSLIGKILLIRIALQLVEMVRLMLALRALGIGLTLTDVAVFAIASFVGTAVSIVPAGLGVSEGVVALLSPIIGLNPATGFVAAAINRIVVMAALVAVTSVLLAFPGRGLPKKSHAENSRG
jgi:hypothetical protein